MAFQTRRLVAGRDARRSPSPTIACAGISSGGQSVAGLGWSVRDQARCRPGARAELERTVADPEVPAVGGAQRGASVVVERLAERARRRNAGGER